VNKSMRSIIYSMPEHIVTATNLVPRSGTGKRKFARIVVCGMGGSGISGQILKVLYPQIPIISNRDYAIPEYCIKHTLSILISYSGNTEETLSNYALLSKHNADTVIISSDGELLEKKCRLKITIPAGLPPRGALGYLFTPLPLLLYRFKFIHHNPQSDLISLGTFLRKQRGVIEKQAQRLSKKFINKLPIIYVNSQQFLPVAIRWQCQLNENAKIMAHTNIIPEMNHNEIVGFGRPQSINKNLLLIFLNDPRAHPRNKIRVDIVKEIIKKKNNNIINIEPQGTNHLQRMFWTIMLGDFISYYCAIREGIDPMPVKRIDYLKKRLSQYT
jgi:glucose/mannose-6-phosphate isomerase